MRLTSHGGAVLEALWATVVIGVGVLSIALLTAGLLRGNRRSQLMGAASIAAEEEMESLVGGAPLNLNDALTLGLHPPNVGASSRYEGLDRFGQVAAASVPAGSSGYESLRRWEVSDASTTRCMRRVRVWVSDTSATSEIASAETYVNCP